MLLLKTLIQLLWILPLNLCFTYNSPWLYYAVRFLDRDIPEMTVYSHCIQSGVIIVLICPIIGDVDFVNLNYKVSSKFLLHKIIHLSLKKKIRVPLFNKYIWNIFGKKNIYIYVRDLNKQKEPGLLTERKSKNCHCSPGTLTWTFLETGMCLTFQMCLRYRQILSCISLDLCFCVP